MEQSKIDIGKIIDTKLSEDITITRCDTEVWIKNHFHGKHGWPAEAMHRDIL